MFKGTVISKGRHGGIQLEFILVESGGGEELLIQGTGQGQGNAEETVKRASYLLKMSL